MPCPFANEYYSATASVMFTFADSTRLVYQEVVDFQTV